MINIVNLEKHYNQTHALAGLSLNITENGIYCLLGRNGAGKTTLLKLIAGHINPSEGYVEVNGRPISMLKMPTDVHFIESNAPQFNIPLDKLFHAASQLNPNFDLPFALKIAARFKLNLNKKYKQLSFGMKVMTNTILGMASNRPIIILDEPVLGFDAVMRKTFYELLSESCAQKPKIVIISTHLIDEIAGVAEKFIILDNGRLALYTNINEIDEKAYTVTGPAAAVDAATQGLNTLGKTKVGGFISAAVYDTRIQSTQDYQVQSLGLQDFFIKIVGEE